jgi:hypothetical protein
LRETGFRNLAGAYQEAGDLGREQCDPDHDAFSKLPHAVTAKMPDGPFDSLQVPGEGPDPLASVDGVDTFAPSWQPVSTWMPTAWAGWAAALMVAFASSADSCPGLTDKVTDRYPGGLILAQRGDALRGQRVDHRGHIPRLGHAGRCLVDQAGVLGVGQLPAADVQHYRAGHVGLIGK